MPTIDEDDDEVVGAAPLPTPSHGGGAPLPDSDDEAEPALPPPVGDPPSDQAGTDDTAIDCRSDSSDGERMMFDPDIGFQRNQLGGAPQSLCSAGSFGIDGSPGSSSGAMGPSGPGGPPDVCDPAKTGAAKEWMGGSEVAEAPQQWLSGWGGSEVASQVPATSLGDVGNLADLQAAQSLPPTPPPPPRPTIGQPGGVSPPAAMPTGVSPPARAPPAYSRNYRRSMRPLQHVAAMNSSSKSAWNTPGHRARMGPVLMGNSCNAKWHGSCNGHNSFSYSCDHLNGKFCGSCCRASGGCSVHF